MKQRSTEDPKARLKREAVRGVALFALLQAACAVCFGALCFIPDLPTWWQVCFGVLAGFCLLLILPAVFVLKSRFREIEKGELDAAAEY